MSASAARISAWLSGSSPDSVIAGNAGAPFAYAANHAWMRA